MEFNFDLFLNKYYQNWLHTSFEKLLESGISKDLSKLDTTMDEQHTFESGENVRCQFHASVFNGHKHNHNFVEIIYVYKGQCSHTIGNTRYTLRQGDFCFINPLAYHCLDDTDSTKSLIINILIRKSFIRQIFLSLANEQNRLADFYHNCFRQTPSLAELLFQPESYDHTRALLFLQLMVTEYLEKKDNYRNAVDYAASLFVLEFTRMYQDKAVGMIPYGIHGDMQQILSYMEENCSTVTLESAAEYFNYHPTYLPQYIKKHTGKTFSDLLLQFRIQKAKELLEDDKLTNEEILLQTGYSNLPAFNRVFKRCTGITMNQYRKIVRSGN